MRIINKYLGNGFRAVYSNSTFRSRMMFGLETWGGVSKTLINRVQRCQDQASKLALPRQYKFKSARQRQDALGWLSIDKEIKKSTLTQTFKIINLGTPQEMASLMPTNQKSLRVASHKKLDTRPRWLGSNKITKSLFRTRSYVYNTLPSSITTLPDVRKFKKKIKEYLKKKLNMTNPNENLILSQE